MIKEKNAAMEMSVGTIVTIVLLMTVLILGLVLVRTIFSGAKQNIDSINDAVKSEIQKLFSEDNKKKIVVIPSTREVVLKKGDSGRGFGLSIRNIESSSDKFSYEVRARETSCEMPLSNAEDLIILNKKRNNILIPAGNIMDEPVFVQFNIPETAPPCKITYVVDLQKGTQPYGSSIDVYVTVEGK